MIKVSYRRVTNEWLLYSGWPEPLLSVLAVAETRPSAVTEHGIKTLWRATATKLWWSNWSIKVYTIPAARLSGAVGSVAVRTAWLRWSTSLGLRPRLAGSLCQVIAAYALRLSSQAGTEGSTVSSLICDRWLMLGLETLSISRCLNHW